MKFVFFSFALFYSLNLFATCDDDFNDGIIEYNFASRHFASGVSAYNQAVALSKTENPKLLRICELLTDSVSGFLVSDQSYLGCSNAFSSAVNSCTGADRDQAQENIGVCLSNQSIARDNLATMRGLLKNTCFVARYRVLSESQLNANIQRLNNE